MPKRIQRQRTKGWRMPEGAIYVGRPTVWGNPFDWRDPLIVQLTKEMGLPRVELWTRAVVKGLFGWWMGGPAPLVALSLGAAAVDVRGIGVELTEGTIGGSLWMPRIGFIDIPLRPDVAPLRGHDLACWCPIEDPDGFAVACHADVLLELANQ